ncbi:minor capsid protein [Desulfosporosinus sp. FKA]|uniref:minor capsid protein n=1 Tax=Desulfosporosinus sp. FKA TaxID=1969834 RepID=UPI000B49E8FE|nr:minor capsid protein [Desulfosporosinus sp. FKA]
MANLLTKLFDMFVNILPENATRTAKDDPGLTIKTSPLLWPYEIFVLEWERRTLLRDLELLVKRDSRLDRANYVMANAATRGGITVTVGGSRTTKIQKKAQEIIDKLMKDTKLNAHLPAWARTVLRDGDIFLNVIPAMNPDGMSAHITRIKNLPAISMERLDDMTDSFPDLKRAFLQIDPITRQEIQAFPLWSVNHIRWKYEPGERYGRSQYYSGRPMWKKLQMTEEDMVVRRRTRAVQRRVHVVGDKDNPGTDTELKKYIKDNRLDDPKNSRITADYFINGLGDVRNLEGDAHLDHIKDVEYLLENAMIGTGVPLHILGFGRNVNRDVVEDQKRTYKEDVKGIQDLLENGDPGTFSGIRAIFNMALALGGINPEEVSINIGWAQLDELTFGEATDTVLKLRAAQPKPQITAKRGLTILAPFLDFDNEQAIDDELKAIDEEIASDKAAQAVEANAVNPEKPSPVAISKSTVASAGRAALDSKSGGSNVKKSSPLRSDKMAKFESDFAGKLKDSFSEIAQKLTSEKFVKNIAHLTGQSAGTEQVSDRQKQQSEVQLDEKVINIARVDLELLQNYVLGQFNTAWNFEEKTMSNHFLTSYLKSIGLAEETLQKDIRESVSFSLVSKEVQDILKDQIKYRLKGIQATTQKELMKAISDAYEDGDNVAGYTSRMKDVVDVPEWRLNMIARTEMAYAFNTANLKYQAEAGYTRFRSEAVVDNRTCPICLSKNGGIFDLNDEQPPYHPNCRCIWLPVE